MQTEYSQGSAPQSLFSISWPIFIDLLLHLSTLVINTLMVKQVSTAYVAAMGVGNQVFNLNVTVLSFISVGCSVVVAQYLGSGNRDMAVRAIHVAIAFNLFLGLFSASVVVFFASDILYALNTPSQLMYHGHLYLFTLGLCLFPEAISLILASCLRVYGYAKTAMYVTLIANICTVLGNFVALYGIGGVEPSGLYGVGCSTFIGRLISIILLLFLFTHGLGMRFHLRFFWQWGDGILQKILHIGLPAAGENLLWTGQYMTIFAFIGLMGEEALAAQTLYFLLAHFIMSLGIAVSLGNEILVGYYVGAKRFDDAYRKTFQSLRVGLFFTILTVVIIWGIKKPLLAVMVGDTEIVHLLLPLFSISLLLEPGRTFNIVMVNALRAAGDARFPMFMGIIFMWGVAVPVAYTLGIVFKMGLVGIWIGFLCDEWLRGLANAWRWKSRKWEGKRLAI